MSSRLSCADNENEPPAANPFDVIALFGDLEPSMVRDILLLRPTPTDLEAAHAAVYAGEEATSVAPLTATAAAIRDLVVECAVPGK
jgi:hypothetical protein